MRRVVILATLVALLLAVAGVTAATENTFITDSESEDQTESTSLESTAPEDMDEATVETTVEKTVETTVETTVPVPAKPEKSAPEKSTPDAANHHEAGADESGNTGKSAFQPDGPDKLDEPGQMGSAMKHAKPENAGGPDHPGKPARTGRPETAGDPEENGEDRGQEARGNPGKVTLCHKDRVTISVGAPAQPAHLRHGDNLGACSGARNSAARAPVPPADR